MVSLFKLAFGDVPKEWIRLMAFGALAVWVAFSVRDFTRSVKSDNEKTREALIEYIASNKAWQDASTLERARYVRKIDARFERVYRANGLEYERLDP